MNKFSPKEIKQSNFKLMILLGLNIIFLFNWYIFFLNNSGGGHFFILGHF